MSAYPSIAVRPRECVLDVTVWGDENLQGDLLQQATFPLRHVCGLTLREASDKLAPIDVVVYTPGGPAAFPGTPHAGFYEEFNDALAQLTRWTALNEEAM